MGAGKTQSANQCLPLEPISIPHGLKPLYHAGLQPPNLQRWEVMYHTGVNVRSAKDLSATILGFKLPGARFLGRQEGNWVALFGEPGYMMLTKDTKVLVALVAGGDAPSSPLDPVEYQYLEGNSPCRLRFEVVHGKLIQIILSRALMKEITQIFWMPADGGGMITDQVGHSWPVPSHHIAALKALADHSAVPNNIPHGFGVPLRAPSHERVSCGARTSRCVEIGEEPKLHSKPDQWAEAPFYASSRVDEQSDNERVYFQKAPTLKRPRSASLGRKNRLSGSLGGRASSMDRQRWNQTSVPNTGDDALPEAASAGDIDQIHEVGAEGEDERPDFVDHFEDGAHGSGVDIEPESSLDDRTVSLPYVDAQPRKDVIGAVSKKCQTDYAGPLVRNVLFGGSVSATSTTISCDTASVVSTGKDKPNIMSKKHSSALRAANSPTPRAARPRATSPNVNQVRASGPRNAAQSPTNEIQVLNDAYNRLVGHPPPLSETRARTSAR